MKRLMTPAMRLALLAAALVGPGVTAAAEPVHVDQSADKHTAEHTTRHTKKHAKKHAATQAHAHAHQPAHASAHAAPHKVAHTAAHAKAHAAMHAAAAPAHHLSVHKAAHQPAQQSLHKLVHDAARKPVHESPVKSDQLAAHAAAHAAALAPQLAPSLPARKSLPKLAPNPDPNGDGFLNLYVELCVKRIGEIDAFHDKLLREKVPKLQPDSAGMFLSGMAGDAWPVPYQGKMGNFVLVLPKQKNLCMLYARRTDTTAVEQGFADMVAKPPEPMVASRGPQAHAVTAGQGETHTVSTSWAPPGSERRMQFMLTTTSDPNAQVQAFGSVAIVVGPEPGPGPDRAAASAAAPPATRKPSGSPAPAPRPHAQP